MFPEAEEFAEEFRQYNKSLGLSDDFAKWMADSWLNSLHGMYETSHDNADWIEQIDSMREILRQDIPIKEKIARLEVVNPMPRKP
jgi:aspartokinase-like uncharacterized kinase